MILKSRKFWLMVADVVVSSATYIVSWLVDPALADKVIWLIGLWQPVMVALITGIATEDAAKLSNQ